MRTDICLDWAEDAAYKSNDRIRVGAVVVDGSRIVGVGTNNMVKSHPLYYPANIHAELSAILNSSTTAGCSIYIVRILKNGERANAKPCPRCEALIKQVGIRKVVFS